MILNNDQLQDRAREFSLTSELATTKRSAAGFRPVFQADVASLHAFAERLAGARAECVQPAEDWLLDHIAFLETQAQEVVRKLSRSTLKALPKLKDQGTPRIYAICEDYLAHVDGRYDEASFTTYLQAYQEISVLEVLECWALPLVMRVVIIHRLALAMREVRHRHEVCRRTAELLEACKNRTDDDIRQLLHRYTDGRPLSPVEVVHFMRHLSECQPDIRVVRNWLAAYVENSQSSLEKIVSFEHQLQAELQVQSGNLVTSLHVLERQPWRTTFAKISHVDQILSSEASLAYERMDVTSQDVLRNRVAAMARKMHVPEVLVAQTAVQLVIQHQPDKVAATGDPPSRNACLTHYLFDPVGITVLRHAIAKHTKPRRLPELVVRQRPLSTYLTSVIGVLVVLLVAGALWVGLGRGLSPAGWIAVVAALLIPVSEWAVTFVNETTCRFSRPTPLLRYDFSEGVPEDARTMVVIPTIWSSTEEVDDVMDRLQVHYLANRQKNIHFAVLGDFADASTQSEPGDRALLAHAVQRIQALQAKYGEDRFFLFHRSRKYNPADQQYMGWERKRGKLTEFVNLLSGKTHGFTTIHGQTDCLERVRYVFTVDHDTQLPIGVVSRMIGTIHFPYNRPRLNPEGTRVVEGYGVLQPSFAVSFESTQKSRFAALWSGQPGIDPYAFAVSNPYQDLFGKSVFVGKGIFDVAAFRQTLANRIPDNQVLSHDVLEGGFLRTGFVSDIEVVEDTPSTVFSHQCRAHRWIRGDWQLIKWLGHKCPDRTGRQQRVDLCALTRWHMIDNMRRSLLAPAVFVMALLGLNPLPGRASAWEAIALLTVFLPFVRALGHVAANGRGVQALSVSFLQSLVQLVMLPFTAVVATDAIIRALWRTFVSGRKLLEWTPAHQVDRDESSGRVVLYEFAGYVIAALYIALAWWTGSVQDIAFGVVAILWCFVRPVVHQLNRPVSGVIRPWLADARTELRDLARQIWSFYADYVTAEESWLPPDNVQYHPKEVIAHRTSPTNIGLYLACVVAARDLDFIDTAAMVDRLQNTLQTVANLEKWHGHLLNWYDTQSAAPLSPRYVSTVDSGHFVAYLMVVRQGLRVWRERDDKQATRMDQLIDQIDELIQGTNFQALYNPNERLFCLGFRVDDNRRDSVLYDLLASEARQASFVAIALGQVPVSHWFTLSRTMTISGGHKTLLSWSGTMFEYLMPSLLMRTYRNTVWDATTHGVIHRQQAYAKAHGVPFGISESGYYAFDYQLNYQYRAFGVPGLGLDRGLERNLVVAPYATMLALPYAGRAALDALEQFRKLKACGTYGFFEAVDFTPDRMPPGARHQVIQSFMAHHQGMSLLSLYNLLSDDDLIDRFHADPHVRAANLLLQERIPTKAAIIEEPIGKHAKLPQMSAETQDAKRVFDEPTVLPEVNVLSNGRLTSVTTNHGAGQLLWNGLALTRWREDPVTDASGMAIYLHDPISEEIWSATDFPCKSLEHATTSFHLDKTSYTGVRHGVSSTMEITVDPELDAEVRSIRLTNESSTERIIEVTSFLELALASPAADSAHPAFSKLFVQTSHDEDAQCLLAKRRSREEDDPESWAVHTVYVDGREAGDYEFETDRAAFITRGYNLEQPKALTIRLRGSTGSVADPAFIMRRSVSLKPGETATVYVVTGAANSRDEALELVLRLSRTAQASHAFHLAWARSQIDLRHMNLSANQAMDANRLASRLYYTPPLSPRRCKAIAKNELGQSSLWSLGISGDAPIAVVSVVNVADLPFVALLARQHQYLCAKGLALDLIILNETKGGYQDELMHRLRDRLAANGLGDMKRIIGLKSTQLSDQQRTLLLAVARVWLRSGGPNLRSQLALDGRIPSQLPPREPRARRNPPALREARPVGEFFNGYGGFVENGRAYQVHVEAGGYLPRPWTNVLANPHFGTLVTELGTGYTWWRNSRECKLTPWTNDPVLDPPGECLYLRDVTSDDIWSAAPKPVDADRAYDVTHGLGFTRFTQSGSDVSHTMEVVVPLDDPVKLVRLKLRNRTNVPKAIAVTYYAEWVLGVTREAQAPFIVTEWDKASAALLARNTYQETFRDAIGFLHMSAFDETGAVKNTSQSWTADRTEFIGPDGTLARPHGLVQDALSNHTGTFSNTCGALQAMTELAPGEEATFVILLGCTDSREAVTSIIQKYNAPDGFDRAFDEVIRYWEGITGQVQVRTPDRAMDLLLNGWLLYQALCCRLWARTAFYQAGGAFGFRDQLQDALALLHTDASIAREQILRNAAHQYEEGDVQHWWHEETHKGIRTRYSDDLLWLPYAVSRYVEHTGNIDILREQVPFLHSSPLKEDELERYEDTVVSAEQGTILEHCLRAVKHASKFGVHGIPLMGIGDWNDGMNHVGAKGRGESVWLGWFLLDVLKRFTALLEQITPDSGMIDLYQQTADALTESLNKYAWDGAWFRRAFTDAGTWLGSIDNSECRIDAITQSWSVISQGTDFERQLRAMRSFDRELVDRDFMLARLLTKAFDRTEPSPGYIQGYPPGIRENGGQYTHGVIWSIVAWAILGERSKAHELFALLNPIAHTQTARDVSRFGNEPYIMSADVYTAAPHEGSAGWSWYTGAAGWMYQAGLEYILGITRRGSHLYVQPCVPPEWHTFTVDYRYGKTTYHLEVNCDVRTEDMSPVWVIDGETRENAYLELVDDGNEHTVQVSAVRRPHATEASSRHL